MVDKAYVEDEIIGQKKKSKNKSTKKSIKRVLKSNKTSIFAWNGKCLTPDCNGEGNTNIKNLKHEDFIPSFLRFS